MTTAIDLFTPDFTTSNKTVVNLEGHDPSAPGDRLAYTINVNNTGQDPGREVVLTDLVPPGTIYVPGFARSRVRAEPQASRPTAAGDDQAEFLDRTGERAVPARNRCQPAPRAAGWTYRTDRSRTAQPFGSRCATTRT